MIAFFTSLMVGSAFSESTLLFPKGFTFDPSSKTGMENDLVKIKKSLNADKHTLVLTETKKSLLGNHYTLQHMVNGLAVANSQLVISTEAESSKVTKIYSNLSSPTDFNAQSLPLSHKRRLLNSLGRPLKAVEVLFLRQSKNLFSQSNLNLFIKLILAQLLLTDTGQ
jgi:hypothetical protein